jgi:hypothetical protein
MNRCLEAKKVAQRSKATDLTYSYGCKQGATPKRLSRVDIREVNLDNRNADSDYGVSKAHARVGQPSGIEQNHVGPAPRLVKSVNEDPFLVGLKELDLDAPRLRCPPNFFLELTEAHASVDLWLSQA